MALTREEINRKLLHIISGTAIPGGIFYIPEILDTQRYVPSIILLSLLIVSLGTEAARFRIEWVQNLFMKVSGSMLRKNEDKMITGATYIFASSFICSLVFYSRPDISFIVLSMFILGDAAAALTGLSVGRIKIGNKSLEGSMAFLITCILLFFLVYPNLPGILDNWGGEIPIVTALSVSLFSALLELFPVKLGKSLTFNDNLYVPVAAGLLIMAISPVAGSV